jgi:serine/threonine protein kinase
LKTIGKKTNPSLPWENRYSIALEMASTINYLHTGCNTPVIHRDIKSANILLTDEYEPRVNNKKHVLYIYWVPLIIAYRVRNHWTSDLVEIGIIINFTPK